MKNYNLLSLAIILSIFSSCNQPAKRSSTENAEAIKKIKNLSGTYVIKDALPESQYKIVLAYIKDSNFLFIMSNTINSVEGSDGSSSKNIGTAFFSNGEIYCNIDSTINSSGEMSYKERYGKCSVKFNTIEAGSIDDMEQRLQISDVGYLLDLKQNTSFARVSLIALIPQAAPLNIAVNFDAKVFNLTDTHYEPISENIFINKGELVQMKSVNEKLSFVKFKKNGKEYYGEIKNFMTDSLNQFTPFKRENLRMEAQEDLIVRSNAHL